MNDQPGQDSWLALAAAVRGNDAGTAEKILLQSPRLGTRLDEELPEGAFGATALLTAVHAGNQQLIDVLLRAGAGIDARSHWWAGGFGVLDHGGGLEDFLVERGATVDVHAAARLGRLGRLEELVGANPSLVHARGGDGKMPLHFAASVGIADYLLAQGADIDARDVDHESTPAQYLVREHPEVARHLVARGCRADILMLSALGDSARVRRLLDADPDSIRKTVSEEFFPKKNIHSGGSIYQWTLGWHKTPHALAREFGHEDIVRLLLERTPEDLKLAIACELGDEPLMRRLLAAAPRRIPGNLLHKVVDAARNNQTAAVRLMLEAGWPADARGQHSGTLLHWAAFHGNAAMTEAILRHAPPLEEKDRDFNSTPLGWALHGSTDGWHRTTGDYPTVVHLLLTAGAIPPEKTAGTPEVQSALRTGLSSNK